VDRDVSIVAAIPAVRAALVEPQRRLIDAGPAVVVGRDTGTSIFPDALLKVYLDASLDERARRRRLQYPGERESAEAESAAINLDQRDRRDRGRTVAPLTVAPDALRIDTDELSVGQVIDDILSELYRRAEPHPPRPGE
jgi:CMP/dCMP kinase